MRAVVSAPLSAASASPRDFGGSRNAGGAASVSAAVRSTIRLLERESIMNLKSALAIIALLVSNNAALAADTAGSSSTRSDPMMDRYTAATERQDWKSAATAMR